MLGDRNLFRPRPLVDVEGTLRALDAADAARSLDDLEAARRLLEELREERDRLAWEIDHIKSSVPWWAKFLPTGERETYARGLLEQIDRFVGETFARIEAQAVNDPHRAAALLRATRSILELVRGESPTQDLRSDVAQLADDVKREAKIAGASVGAGALVALAVAVLVLVARR